MLGVLRESAGWTRREISSFIRTLWLEKKGQDQEVSGLGWTGLWAAVEESAVETFLEEFLMFTSSNAEISGTVF